MRHTNNHTHSYTHSHAHKHPLSAISVFHYFRLIYRSVLFILAIFWYVHCRITEEIPSFQNLAGEENALLLQIIWCIFMLEMLLRFFPSRLESPGCQKQFRQNYQPTGKTNVLLHDNNATIIVMLVWIVVNLFIGALYMADVLDEGILMLLCLAYSVCDMICILFFCPFQTWFLKNKCCCSCRIYNWDYAMMFTPLFFIRGLYSYSLLIAALCLMIRWEITVWRYPERFSENTNSYLACAHCSEKLCTHKKQLITFQKSLIRHAENTIHRILSGKNP